VYFLIPTKFGKTIIVHGKSSTRDNYHRSGELAGRIRFSRYLFDRGKIKIDYNKEWVLVLDGNWKSKYIKRLYEAGVSAIFTPQKLNEDWQLIQYLKQKHVLTK
jgi:hypothetical protein